MPSHPALEPTNRAAMAQFGARPAACAGLGPLPFGSIVGAEPAA